MGSQNTKSHYRLLLVAGFTLYIGTVY